jgi:hypothetical protein
MTGTEKADLESALLVVLMYMPDQLARKYAQDQLTDVMGGKPADPKLLARIVKIIKVKAGAAHRVDVYRACDVIEKASKV